MNALSSRRQLMREKATFVLQNLRPALPVPRHPPGVASWSTCAESLQMNRVMLEEKARHEHHDPCSSPNKPTNVGIMTSRRNRTSVQLEPSFHFPSVNARNQSRPASNDTLAASTPSIGCVSFGNTNISTTRPLPFNT